jgi:MFS family permease
MHRLHGMLLVLLGLLLAVTAALRLAWSASVLAQPGEVMLGEGILYGHVAELVRGKQLYRPVDEAPYTIANYTPLYYLAAGASHGLMGPGLLPGRLLSLAAGLTAAGLVGALAARGTGSGWAGALAASTFLALGIAGRSPAAPPWIALYKEDALGVALGLGAITALANSGQPTRRRVMIGGALAGLAILTKQTFVAAALAGFVWLAWHQWRRAALFAAVGAAVVLCTAVYFELTSGAFLENAVFSNASPLSLDALLFGLRRLAWSQLGPLVVAAVYVLGRVWTARLGRAESLLVLYWLASMLPVLGVAMVGSNYNYWMELAAVTAVLATLCVWRNQRDVLRLSAGLPVPGARTGLVLAARLGPAALLTVYVASVAPSAWLGTVQGIAAMGQNRDRANEFADLVRRIESESGAVLSDPADASTLAERRTLLEPFVFTILHQQGRWDPSPVVDLICSGRVSLLVLNRPLEEFDRTAYHGFTYWPQPVVAALRGTFVFQAREGERFFYVPGGAPGVAGVAGVPGGDAAGRGACSPTGETGAWEGSRS